MMNDEQKMIFGMLKAGEISAEEAERLMDAVGVPPHWTGVQGVTPKRLRVRVTEHGRQKVNVKIPFAVVRLALKLGKGMDGLIVSFGGDDGARVAEALRQVDLDELLRQLGDGEIPLPCTLADVDAEGDVNVLVVLE
ncbi:MAG: hypothetical protein FWF60_08025 [Oscillospiraceae bacterium]|nr:hypothetical protein [Oscillospiraceae bacterium]